MACLKPPGGPPLPPDLRLCTNAIEQGFRADIEERRPAEAESILTEMLESGDAIDAKCVHGDWHILDIEEDTP